MSDVQSLLALRRIASCSSNAGSQVGARSNDCALEQTSMPYRSAILGSVSVDWTWRWPMTTKPCQRSVTGSSRSGNVRFATRTDNG